MKTNKAVILGSNYFIALSILRSLGPQKIHCVTFDHSKENTYASLSKYVSEKHITPHYANEPEAFLQYLIEYSKKQDVKPVLFPCADNYVEFIDKYLLELKDYYLIPQTQIGLYTQVMNKDTLAELAQKYDAPIPYTVHSSDKELIQKIEKYTSYPVLVKPVDSPAFTKVFRRKSFVVNNEKELLETIDKCHASKVEVIIQQIIEGFDDHMYTYDAYLNQDSKVTHWVTCNKFRQWPINYGASSFTIQKYVPELHTLGAPFLEKMGYKGFAEIEFKKNERDGKYYVIEINVRTTTLNSMLEKSGVNFPYVQYMELTGHPLINSYVDKDTNIAFWFEYEDLLAIREYIRQKQLTLKQILPTFKRPLVPAVFDIHDIKPFFGMVSYILSRVFKKFKRSVS